MIDDFEERVRRSLRRRAEGPVGSAEWSDVERRFARRKRHRIALVGGVAAVVLAAVVLVPLLGSRTVTDVADPSVTGRVRVASGPEGGGWELFGRTDQQDRPCAELRLENSSAPASGGPGPCLASRDAVSFALWEAQRPRVFLAGVASEEVDRVRIEREDQGVGPVTVATVADPSVPGRYWIAYLSTDPISAIVALDAGDKSLERLHCALGGTPLTPTGCWSGPPTPDPAGLGELTVEPSSGPVGTEVNLEGRWCWAGRREQTSLSFGNEMPVEEGAQGADNVPDVPIDDDGRFQLTYVIPEELPLSIQGEGGVPVEPGNYTFFSHPPGCSTTFEVTER